MKIFIAYKLSGTDHDMLRERLEEIRKVLINKGHEPFIYYRDAQKYGAPLPLDENLRIVDEEIRKADCILALADDSNGLHFEVGYAKALGKQVIVLGKHKPFLSAIADRVIEFITEF
ncbi:nucleoside 2-deoxyribosyltransferase [Candidatus Woesearchaeota archaeon]|nr:nucleoside 2-deoxyribosyltransferase [Candidatus Woesearchaeota archaeon]MBW3022055.1 nucleoside 2-deoxyribosyltransferase [Candidatus Woesearchaeota archaeon]